MARLTADFETTMDSDDCRVWAWATCDIDEIDRREVLRFGNSIETFFDYLRALDDSKVWFHNLKFDGEFIYNYLLDNGWEWVDSIDMSAPRTFSTLISDKGMHYCIDLRFTWRHTVRILDSLNIIPMPVAKIPKAFGLPDAKLELDYTSYRERGHVLTDAEVDYITEDVVITAKAMRIMLDVGETRMTAGSNALAAYKRTVGGNKGFRKIFPVPDYDEEVRHSYKGGFTYVNPRFPGRRCGRGYQFRCEQPVSVAHALRAYPIRQPGAVLWRGQTGRTVPAVRSEHRYRCDGEAEPYPVHAVQGRHVFRAVRCHRVYRGHGR